MTQSDQLLNLRAGAPVTEGPTGKLVLCSHAENIPPGFDINCIFMLINGVTLQEGKNVLNEIQMTGQTGSREIHFTVA